MTIKTVTLHMYTYTEEFRAGINTVDQYDFRNLPECMNGRVWVGQCEVEIDFPDVDITSLQIEQLEKDLQKDRADSQVRQNILIERISKLKAIGHEVTE